MIQLLGSHVHNSVNTPPKRSAGFIEMAIMLAVILATCCCAFLLGAHNRAVRPAPSDTGPVSAESTEAAVDTREIVRTFAAGSVQKIPDMSLARMQVLADLRRRNVSFQIRIVDKNGMLTPALVELLELSETEQAALQEVFNSTIAAMNRSSAGSATLLEAGKDKVVITVPPLVNSGEIYDDLCTNCERVIGTKRMAAFHAFAYDDLSSALNSFGAEQHTVTIIRRDGEYVISDRKVAANGVFQSRFSDVSKISPIYGWLRQYATQIATIQSPVETNNRR